MQTLHVAGLWVRQHHLAPTDRRDLLQRRHASTPLPHELHRGRNERCSASIRSHEAVDAVSVRPLDRMQQQPIYHAERCRRCTDANTQHQHDERRGTRAAREVSNGVSEVESQVRQPATAPACALDFRIGAATIVPCLGDAAESSNGFAPGGLRFQTPGFQLRCTHVQVKRKLRVHLFGDLRCVPPRQAYEATKFRQHQAVSSAAKIALA